MSLIPSTLLMAFISLRNLKVYKILLYFLSKEPKIIGIHWVMTIIKSNILNMLLKYLIGPNPIIFNKNSTE